MPHSVSDNLAELALLVPSAAVDGDSKIPVAGVVSTLRVSPSTVRELEQTVGWASDRGMAMAVLGGGTKQGIGNPPSRLDLLLDTSALDSIVEYDPENLVLTAQAGITIEHLQSTVREDSLLLPLDPQSGDRATIGGVIACADHGPRRRQYGGLRDLLLGLKVVLPDGSVASFGGRTLKNVAGYDVGKLFIGSLGTIGVIAEATVRLLPLPTCEELLLISLPGLELGRRLVARILESPLLPRHSSSCHPSAQAFSVLTGTSISDGTYLMLIALEGHSAAVERQVRDISLFCAELSSAESKAVARGTPGSAHQGAVAAGRAEMVESRRSSEAGLLPGEGWEDFREVAGEGAQQSFLRGIAVHRASWTRVGSGHSRRRELSLEWRGGVLHNELRDGIPGGIRCWCSCGSASIRGRGAGGCRATWGCHVGA